MYISQPAQKPVIEASSASAGDEAAETGAQAVPAGEEGETCRAQEDRADEVREPRRPGVLERALAEARLDELEVGETLQAPAAAEREPDDQLDREQREEPPRPDRDGDERQDADHRLVEARCARVDDRSLAIRVGGSHHASRLAEAAQFERTAGLARYPGTHRTVHSQTAHARARRPRTSRRRLRRCGRLTTSTRDAPGRSPAPRRRSSSPRRIPPTRPTAADHDQALASRAKPALEAQWPTYGRDVQRTHVSPAKHRPPYRQVWMPRARHFIEFPPVVAYDKIFVAQQRRPLLRARCEDGQAALDQELRPLRGGLADCLAGRRLPRVDARASLPEAPAGRDRPADRDERADRARALELPRRVRSSPRRWSSTASSTSARGTTTSTRSTSGRRRSSGASERTTRSSPVPRTPAERSTSRRAAATSMRSTRGRDVSAGAPRRSRASGGASTSTQRPRLPTAASSSATPTATSTPTERRAAT